MLEFRNYIQNLRKKSIAKIRHYLESDSVRIGLEVGAGDGFQSRILVEYLEKLVVTEYDKKRLIKLVDKRIEYVIADAENIESSLGKQEFDLIFSSHLLEHLPNPKKLFQSSFNIIRKNGLIIHIVPGFWYAVLRVVFYYPSLIVRIKRKFKQQTKFDLLSNSEYASGNNLKKSKIRRSKIMEHIIPRPHGISDTILSEIFCFRKKSWTRLFKSNGLEIIEIINGSFYTGYGFGFKRTKKILSKIGFASEYIYILRKKSND